MRLGEVLRRVPNLDKRFVHYLEAQGYIRPARVPKRRIARREYSEEDLRTISEVWTYYQRGLSPQAAHDRVRQLSRAEAFALLDVPSARWRATIEELRAVERIEEAAIVYGESEDLVVRASALDEVEIYQTLATVVARAGIVGMPEVLRLIPDLGFRRLPATEVNARPTSMLAYVLLKVPAKHIADVLERLKSFNGVTEAAVVYGETDIIAKVEVGEPRELDNLVINQMQGIETVQSTRTFIGVGGLHWDRNSGGGSNVYDEEVGDREAASLPPRVD